MKLKLTNEELIVLIKTLEYADAATFNTMLESRLCGAILREFVTSLMKKSIDMKEQLSIKLDDKTTLALNQVLPQLCPASPFERAVLTNINIKINQRCLSIS